MSAPSYLRIQPAHAIWATPPDRLREAAGRVSIRDMSLFANDLDGMPALAGAAAATVRILCMTDRLLAGLDD